MMGNQPVPAEQRSFWKKPWGFWMQFKESKTSEDSNIFCALLQQVGK